MNTILHRTKITRSQFQKLPNGGVYYDQFGFGPKIKTGTTWRLREFAAPTMPDDFGTPVYVAPGEEDPIQAVGPVPFTSPAGVAAVLSAAAVPNSGDVLLTWTYSGVNPPTFAIYYRLVASGPYYPLTEVSGTARSTTLSGLVPGTDYLFTIAPNPTSQPFSNEASATVPNSGPNPPIPVVASSGTITTTSVVLNWEAGFFGDPDIDFTISYGTTPAMTQTITGVDKTLRTRNMTGLSPGVLYYFSVTGSPYVPSNIVTATTTANSATPGTARWVRDIVAGFNVIPAGVITNSTDDAIGVGAFDSTADFGGGSVGLGALSGYTAKYTTTSNSNTYSWAKLVSANAGSRRVWQTALDSNDGSVVSVGEYNGTVDFGNGFVLTAHDPYGQGVANMFVVKYLADGTTAWAKPFGDGGTGTSPVQGKCVAVDSGGTVYAIGTFFGTNNFGGWSLTASGVNMALLKINGTTGTTELAVRYGTANRDTPKTMAFDDSGDLLWLCGQSTSASDYGGGQIGSSSGQGFFVAYSTTDLSYGGVSRPIFNASVNGICTDGGSVFITGDFAVSVDLGDGVNRTTPWSGNGGFFIAAYISNGALVWGKVYGQNLDAGYAISAGGSGIVVMVGKAAGLTDFNGTGIPTGGNGFIAVAFDTSGLGTYRWSRRASVDSTHGDSSGAGVCITSVPNAYCTGYFKGLIEFGNSITATCPLGKKDGFIVSFTA